MDEIRIEFESLTKEQWIKIAQTLKRLFTITGKPYTLDFIKGKKSIHSERKDFSYRPL